MAHGKKPTPSSSKVKSNLQVRTKRFPYDWVVFLFPVFLFANSIFNNYNLDDELVTIGHRLTSKGISAIPDIFTSPYYQDQSGYAYEYRPVVLVSFAIEHQLFGDNAHLNHFFNILLYALACLILYKVLSLLFKTYSPLLPFGIALLFAAHPAHTEVVCSIKNRDEILGLLFSFLSLLFAFRVIKTKRKWLLLPIMTLFFTLALLSKITVISFVFIIPMALILFSEASILWVIGIHIALLIPSFILLNIQEDSLKSLMISLVMIVAVLILYLIVNYKSAFFSFKSALSNIYLKLFLNNKQGNTETDTSPKVIDLVLQKIIPDKDNWALFPFLISVSLAATYVFVLCRGYSFQAIIPLVLLFILAQLGEKRVSWWATVMIGVCIVVGISLTKIEFNGTVFESWYYHTLCLYFAYQAFYGKAGLCIPSLICLAIVNYIVFTISGVWLGVFYLLIIFYAYKYVRIFSILVLTIMNIHRVYISNESIPDGFDLITQVLIVLTIRYDKFKRELAMVIAISGIVVFHFYQVHGDKRIELHPLITRTSEVMNQVKPAIVSTIQYRPLSFMEETVTANSSFSIRAGTSLEILSHYLRKVILPYPMAYYYGYKFIYPQKITEVVPLITLIIYLLLFIIALIFIRKAPPIAFGILVYLVSVAVFSNFIQPIAGMLADRFLLIPSLGWAIVLVGILQKVFKIKDDQKATEIALKASVKYTFMGILLFYSVIAFSRNLNWKDDLTLFRHDISYVNQSAQAHNLLGLHIMQHSVAETDPIQKAELEKEALYHFKKSQEIYPSFFNVAYDIGRVYVALNMPDSAIAAFKYSVTLDSTFGDAYLTMGNLLIAQTRFSEAVPCYEQVIRIIPLDYVGYQQLSYTYFRMNEFDKSIAVNKQAIQKIHAIGPLINLARTYLAKNQADSARVYLLKANDMVPNNAEIQQMLKQAGN